MLNALEAGDAEAYRQAVLDHYRPLEGVLDAAGAERLDGAAGAGAAPCEQQGGAPDGADDADDDGRGPAGALAAPGAGDVVGRAARGVPRTGRGRGGAVAAP